MRIVLQRVFEAFVRVQGVEISRIKQGVLVFVGFTPSDDQLVGEHMAAKVINMRLWKDKDEKTWAMSVVDIGGDILAVSQFTLYSILKGNKPEFHSAMQAEQARELFDYFVDTLRKKYQPERVQTGKFQALMEVGSIVDGPVTIQYEKLSEENKKIQKGKKQEKANEKPLPND